MGWNTAGLRTIYKQIQIRAKKVSVKDISEEIRTDPILKSELFSDNLSMNSATAKKVI